MLILIRGNQANKPANISFEFLITSDSREIQLSMRGEYPLRVENILVISAHKFELSFDRAYFPMPKLVPASGTKIS